MVKASATIGTALLFGCLTGVTTADGRSAERPSASQAEAPRTAPKEPPIQWKLWIGKKAYVPSPKGGQAPLSKGSDWQCKYSAAAIEAKKQNLKEETVTLTCWAGSAKFSFATSCSYPVDPSKHVKEGVMPSDFQHAILGGRTFVGISCDVPGYELRTYRKK